MKFIYIIGSALLIAMPSFAASDAAFHVQVLDPNLNARGFSEPGVDVHPAQPAARSLSPAALEAVFARAGLGEETKDWDPLAKDLLYIRANHHGASDFANFYPAIEARKLALLQSLVAPAPGSSSR